MPALAETIYAEFDKELGGIDRFKVAAFDLMRNDHYDPEVSYPAETWTDTHRDSTELEIIEGLFEDGGLDMVKPLLDLALPETRATLEHWAEEHRKLAAFSPSEDQSPKDVSLLSEALDGYLAGDPFARVLSEELCLSGAGRSHSVGSCPNTPHSNTSKPVLRSSVWR